MINYLDLLKQSWYDVKSNPLIFIPLLFSFGLGILVLLIGVIVGIAFGVSFSYLDQGIENLFKPSSIALIITVIFLFVLICFVIGAFTRAMQYGSYKMILEQKKLSLSSLLKYGKTYFLKVIGLQLLTCVLFLLPSPILIGIPLGLGALNNYGFLFFIPSIGLYILYGLFLSVGLLFAPAMLFMETKGVLESAKKSIKLLFSQFLHVIITWGLIFAVNLIVAIVFIIPRFSFEILGKFHFIFTILAVLIAILQSVCQALAAIYTGLFLFKAYQKGK